jgi:DNA polymerase III delta prime subunit
VNYYPELSKIIKGALHGDSKTVIAYVQSIIKKLEMEGETLAANGFTELLNKSNLNKFTTQSSFSRPVPVEKDNRFSLADKSIPLLEEEAIFLSPNDEDTVNSFVSYIKKREQLDLIGIPINPTLLLHGHPGTGKSKLASNIAAKLGLPLITARADALISSYLGSTSKNIRSLLEYAQSEPCVLFLDEFDSIAKARDDKNEIGELKRVVVSLLQNIDNLDDTILIAATNHLHLLDPAIGRRFHYKIELLPPKSTERKKILLSLLKKFPFEEQGVERLVVFSDGMTGAEIEMAVYDYLRHSIINEKEVNSIGLLKKLLKVRYSWLNFSPENKTEKIKRLREIDTNIYSGKVLSSLWGISPSYVSKIIKDN